MDLLGLNKDSEIVQAEPGSSGKQSPTHYRFDLMDPPAMFTLGSILHEGAEKYGEDNWRYISARMHVNKALIHLNAWLAKDTQDDHLGHAFCRLMMAEAIELGGGLSEPVLYNADVDAVPDSGEE